MKRSLLIGDSGGTNTDWCFVDAEGKQVYFTSESYHPAQFSDTFFEAMCNFWQDKALPRETEVHFYGAGCSMTHNQEIIVRHFQSAGFNRVYAESDLLGACRGLLGNAPGLVGILGTGSVLAEYDGNKVARIHGGFGYLIGDEGSGYNFGKMLIHQYLRGGFSPEQASVVADRIGDRSKVMKHVYASEGKQWVSRLASIFERNQAIEAIHRQNIEAFVELYLKELGCSGQNICFSGSYAFYNQKILKSVLSENGWNLTECVQKPIEKITVYTINPTL